MLGGLYAWISQRDAQAVIIGAGVIAASLAAIIALFKQPVVARPLRWLGRVLISDPMTTVIHQALDEWASRVWDPRIAAIESKVDEVRAQFDNNGGSTMRDRVDAVASATGAPSAPRVGPPPDDSE